MPISSLVPFNLPRKNSYTSPEQPQTIKDTHTSTYTDEISQRGISNRHSDTVGKPRRKYGERVDRSHLNPARPEPSSAKSSSPIETLSLSSSSDTSSEYIFPMPPSKPAKSVPPPVAPSYSSVNPSISLSKRNVPRNEDNKAIERPVHAIRRTQSAVDIRSPAQWKPLPARPLEQEKGEEMRVKERRQPSPQSGLPRIKSSPENATGNNTRHSTLAQITSKNPTSPISLTREQIQPKATLGGKGSMNIKPQQLVRENEDGDAQFRETQRMNRGNKKNGQSLTTEQILWLHRNYRGEATFLRAWGLHGTRDGDREQGLEILRILMAAELPKGKEQQKQATAQWKQHEVLQSTTTTSALIPRDKDGLDIIEE